MPDECGVVFTSFKGHHSPLRHHATLTSCPGRREIWRMVNANSQEGALRPLPFYVPQRTTVTPSGEVQIP
jgi:hypothetical protein